MRRFDGFVVQKDGSEKTIDWLCRSGINDGMKRDWQGNVAAIVLGVLIAGGFVSVCILAAWLGSQKSVAVPAASIASPMPAYPSQPESAGSSLSQAIFSFLGLAVVIAVFLAVGWLVNQFFRGVGEAVSEVANAADAALAKRSAERAREQTLSSIERQQRIIENDQRIMLNNLKIASKMSKLDSRSDGER
jgi:hypothetical protein